MTYHSAEFTDDMTAARRAMARSDANLRRWVWGAMGAFVGAFWMLAGIPALCWLIQQGGQIVAGVL